LTVSFIANLHVVYAESKTKLVNCLVLHMNRNKLLRWDTTCSVYTGTSPEGADVERLISQRCGTEWLWRQV